MSAPMVCVHVPLIQTLKRTTKTDADVVQWKRLQYKSSKLAGSTYNGAATTLTRAPTLH